MKFLDLFGHLKSVVIGMIHVKALPGTPLGCLNMSQITEDACREAEIYRDAGVGLLNACAGDLLRYRKQIGADHVQIFTDIKKKHSSHALTSDVTIEETAHAAEFFLSDGLIITGAATGVQADPRELRDVSQSVRIPVLIGSGVTYDNIELYLDAHGMIIGSHFKYGGRWANDVDPDQVKRFMEKIRDLRK